MYEKTTRVRTLKDALIRRPPVPQIGLDTGVPLGSDLPISHPRPLRVLYVLHTEHLLFKAGLFTEKRASVHNSA